MRCFFGGFELFLEIYLNLSYNIQMNRLISINEASKQLGVPISTLRKWEQIGVLVKAVLQ